MYQNNNQKPGQNLQNIGKGIQAAGTATCSLGCATFFILLLIIMFMAFT